MTIGDRIKKTRETKGISQTQLAKSVNISKQTLYKYENNIITNIPSDKIELIAGILKVSPAFLMGWEDDEHHFNFNNFLEFINQTDTGWLKQVPLYKTVSVENHKIVLGEHLGYVGTEDERAKDFIALLIPEKEFDPDFTSEDIAIIYTKENTLENNKYFYILLSGSKPTIRKVSIKDKDTIILKADNPQIEIEFAQKNDVVVGKLIAIQKSKNYE